MGSWPTKGGPKYEKDISRSKGGPKGRAGPELDSEGEEEFQDSREGPPPMDPMGPPPVPNLWCGWVNIGRSP